MKRAVILLTMFAITASACRRNAQPAVTAAGSDTTLVVAVERAPCFGFCPVYSVELFESGRVKFTGERNVAVVGTATDTISAAAVDSLKRLISESGFAAFDTAYVLDSPGCGQYATDMPVITLKARVNDALKTVRHELGCRGGPAAIASIAARVDTVTGTAKWIKTGQEGAK
jgi:hypothetical protein